MKCYLQALLRIALCASLLVTHAVSAHPGDENSLATNFDCDKSYPNMIDSLPFPLEEFATLKCFGNGQLIMAKSNWSWRYSGSFFGTPRIPASAHDELTAIPPPYYFTNVKVGEARSENMSGYLDKLMTDVMTFRPKVEITNVYDIELTNNHDSLIRLVIALEKQGNGWLLVCNPDCRPEYVILFNKR